MDEQAEPRRAALSGLPKPRQNWIGKLEKLASSAPRVLDGALHPMDERIARTLVGLIKSVGFRTHERQMQFFDVAQAQGVHVQKNHFYSPLPDTSQIDPAVWARRADTDGGFDLREEAQLDLLQELSSFSHELDGIPEQDEDPASYSWVNPAFWPGDGAAYYCMIRHLGSKRILEVGSGHSTRLAAQAAQRNEAELTCIEPYPMASLKTVLLPGPSRLIERPVQEVPLEEFDQLEENDILFIDSTHVSKIGSDVNHLFLRVIPRLKPGVVIHVHDIFLPWDMPRGWVVDKKIFWNEQYLLQAMLTCNPSFEVLLGNQFLGRVQPEAFRAAFPCIPSRFTPGGVSFWMRRIPA
jgi:predicted O-methyltransferase YrrM